jgi:hypothetical protein
MVAGVAAASPNAFDRVVTEAKKAVLGDHGGGRTTREGRDPDDEGATGSVPVDGCGEIVTAYRRAAPPSDDAEALARAIEVVQENCARSPQARGLVVAFNRLIAKAEGRGAHGAPGGANGRGRGREHGSSEHAGGPGGTGGSKGGSGRGGPPAG